MARILIVEDDKSLATTISHALSGEQYRVESVHCGREADELLSSSDYDAIILDWELPELSGVEILKRFRVRGGITPTLMLTGRSTTDDKEQGLDSGADDYLTKPFEIRELCARVRALLRRPTEFKEAKLKWGTIVLDKGTHTVSRDGEKVALQPMEFTILEFFMRHPGRVFSTEAILRRCWDSDTAASRDSIYTIIRKIRKKLDSEGQKSIIQTVHSVGYSHDPL